MDWLKHFVIQKSDICIETNGLEQGIVCNTSRNKLYLATDNKMDGIYYNWYNKGNPRYIHRFKNDLFHGYQYWFWQNRNIGEIVYYINGKKHGIHIYLNRDKQITQVVRILT